MNRRNSFRAMIALAVAPALVKVEMLMPVKVIMPVGELSSWGGEFEHYMRPEFREYNQATAPPGSLYEDIFDSKLYMAEMNNGSRITWVAHPKVYDEIKSHSGLLE